MWNELSEETKISVYLTACVAVGDLIRKSSELNHLVPKRIRDCVNKPNDRMKMN